jgi:hypothetical protein
LSKFPIVNTFGAVVVARRKDEERSMSFLHILSIHFVVHVKFILFVYRPLPVRIYGGGGEKEEEDVEQNTAETGRERGRGKGGGGGQRLKKIVRGWRGFKA